MAIVNPKDIQILLKDTPLFQDIHETYGPPPIWSRPQGFISLSKIILEQQVSLASANAHFEKLKAYVSEFTPLSISQLSDEELRSCQISRQKASYLKVLSVAIQNGMLDLDALHEMEETEVRKKLTAVKGIGNWSADVYLMFCLQAKDIFPVGDIAVVHTMRELTAANTQEEMLNLSKAWQPLRSLATCYLWHYYLKKRNRTLPWE